jgi:methoxymalonate biosynthesis acyl carrier protein
LRSRGSRISPPAAASPTTLLQEISMSAQQEESVKTQVRNFISHSTQISALDDDDNLFESGIVNSLFAVQLMTFVEKTFAIDVEMEDLDIENFKSLNATAAFVMRKAGRRVD